jgi:2-oxoglutarate ferredoxin oxidoreductase subunit alpha
MDIRAKYLKKFEKRTLFMLGDEACSYGALFAGCNFFGGYPITPASEVAEVMARELPNVNGYYVQFEDELASIGACVGAAWAGAKAMTATSGPGFSLMQENIGYAVMTETPVVIVDVQRSGPSTGQATKAAQGDVMQARWGTHGDHNIIALAPNSVQETFDMMIESFNLSEQYRTPVILLTDGEIGHLREKLTFPLIKDIELIDRPRPEREGEMGFGGKLIPPFIEFDRGENVHVTGSTHKEDGMRDVDSQPVHDKLIRRIYKKIEVNRDKIIKVEKKFLKDPDIAVVSYGATARPALGAVLKARANKRSLKKNVGMLRLQTIWPFPQKDIAELGKKVEKILVPEMNLGQISREIERFVNTDECKVVPVPKIGGIVHSIDEIYSKIKEFVK